MAKVEPSLVNSVSPLRSVGFIDRPQFENLQVAGGWTNFNGQLASPNRVGVNDQKHERNSLMCSGQIDIRTRRDAVNVGPSNGDVGPAFDFLRTESVTSDWTLWTRGQFEASRDAGWRQSASTLSRIASGSDCQTAMIRFNDGSNADNWGQSVTSWHWQNAAMSSVPLSKAC